MVYKASFFLALILISNTLLLNVAGRSIGKNPNNQDKKEPEFFFGHGHIGFPPAFGVTPRNPFNGGGGAGARTGRSYVPGGDDTFVPNPGFEVPIPGGSGRVTPVGGGRVTPVGHP